MNQESQQEILPEGVTKKYSHQYYYKDKSFNSLSDIEEYKKRNEIYFDNLNTLNYLKEDFTLVCFFDKEEGIVKYDVFMKPSVVICEYYSTLIYNSSLNEAKYKIVNDKDVVLLEFITNYKSSIDVKEYSMFIKVLDYLCDNKLENYKKVFKKLEDLDIDPEQVYM